MNVLLIKPTKHTDAITPPLGLGYLASRIRSHHEVKIVDAPLLHLTEKKFIQIFREFQPDVVGTQMLTMDIVSAWRYLSLAKKLNPDCVTVAGGPQPSGEPEGTMHWFGSTLDYAFVGEAEDGFDQLLQLLEENRDNPSISDLREVPALVWREEGHIRINPLKRVQDLDALGFPAWDLMNPRLYPPSPHAAYAKAFPVGCITATRGCPYACDFCAATAIQGKKLRTRSVGHVMEEIDLLVNRYGMKEIHLVDDNFTYYRDYVLEFCEEKSRRFPKVPWTCPNGVRLDSLDPELLLAMKNSGCHVISMGIESGSQKILDLVRKKQTVETVLEKVEQIKRAGMDTVGFFILGFPGETIEDMEKTVQFSLSLPLVRAHYMFYHPLPGTEGYRRLLRECPECFRKVQSSLETIAYVDKGVTEKQLKAIQRKAFLRFYFRPSQFSALFMRIRHPAQIYYIAKRISRWMIFN